MKFLELLSLLLVLLHSPKGGSVSRIRCLERERQALLTFKHEVVDTSGRLSSWSDKEHKRECCKWKGVECHNISNHVTRLDLLNDLGYDHCLKGTISTSLLELQQLQYLDLSYNDFEYVPIPEFIGSLSELRYLNLQSANFRGQIPHHLGNLSKLLHLDLSLNKNCYSESLDWVSHLHSLEHLDLTYANLSRATNWLQAVSKLDSIKVLSMPDCELPHIPPSLLPSNINASAPLASLDLSYNSFTFFPLTLIRWFSNFSSIGLTSIDLSGNKMSGPIPDIFANMVSLAHLYLFEAGLEGGIPSYFGNMSNLVDIYLNENNLSGELSELMMNLSGPIEDNLQSLDLSWNSISGSFPNMSRFSSLTWLVLKTNQLNGSIQEGYLILPHLLELDLTLNQLTGPFPDLSFLSSLKYLRIRYNNFNGTLTESIPCLSNLEELGIGSNFFEGIITEVSMSNLSQLQVLDLSSNPSLIVKFSPHWVPPFQLQSLRLKHCRVGPDFPLWFKTQKQLVAIDISATGILDNIPSWFAGIARNLLYLNASNNQITGVFPDSALRHSLGIVLLDLSRNNIFGSIDFLCHIKHLFLLDLSDNNLSGRIPNCFTQIERLKYLNLANNNFSGKIPHSFGSLSAVSLLHLRNNSFSGELPTSMANCMKLVMIDIGENRLTGKVPSWIGEGWPQLKVLILRFNEFYGSIPSNLCGLANIQVLDLSSNKISGVIPNCVRKHIAMTQKQNENRLLMIYDQNYLYAYRYPVLDQTHQFQSAYFMWKGKEVKYVNNMNLVKLIDLSSNNLVGEIPSEITKLVGLVGLNFSINNLIGSIPRDIGQMNSLDFLDFSRNQLSGSIPASLSELSFLGVLNLSYNNLSGRIPPSNKLLTFEVLSYMGNSGLCGLPLNKSCSEDEPHPDSDSSNSALSKEDVEDDGFISEGFYIALGLGFIVGFWGIVGTILLNKAMQYAFVKVMNTVEDFVYVRVEITKARLLRRFKNG